MPASKEEKPHRRGKWQRIMIVSSLIVAVILVAGALFSWRGAVAFRDDANRKINRLFADVRDASIAPIDSARYANLPQSVRKWLQRTGTTEKASIHSVRVKQSGEFRMQQEGAWYPFTSQEYFTVDPPGFIWTARISGPLGFPIYVTDSYVNGKGEIDGRLLGLIPVVQASGKEVDQGARLRFLNEIMWFPSAALHPAITWQSVDSVSARATFSDRDQSVSAIFYFGADGDLVDMRADRYREENGSFHLATWSTPLDTHKEMAGLRIPVRGEGVWKLQAGDFHYIRLRIDEIEFNYPARYP